MNENTKTVSIIVLGVLCLFTCMVAGASYTTSRQLRSELDDVRRINSDLEKRNNELEARDRVRQELIVYITTETRRADSELADAISRARGGIDRIEATIRAFEDWGNKHKAIEREIIERLEAGEP